jgi:hypothetical protein
MTRVAAAVLLAVELGAGFGSAAATVETMGEESMVIDLRVEVDGSPDSVVAHLSLPDEDTITLPMLVREEGVYGVTTEVKPANYVVVFEVIGDPGAESIPASLGELGVDFSSNEGTTQPEEDTAISAPTQQWLWLGVALGAASLSALAFWVLGGRDEAVIADDLEEGAVADDLEEGAEPPQAEAAEAVEEPSQGP